MAVKKPIWVTDQGVPVLIEIYVFPKPYSWIGLGGKLPNQVDTLAYKLSKKQIATVQEVDEELQKVDNSLLTVATIVYFTVEDKKYYDFIDHETGNLGYSTNNLFRS
jgi:hypothetical protein